MDATVEELSFGDLYAFYNNYTDEAKADLSKVPRLVEIKKLYLSWCARPKVSISSSSSDSCR